MLFRLTIAKKSSVAAKDWHCHSFPLRSKQVLLLMKRFKELQNRVVILEKAFFENQSDKQKQASIISERRDVLNELFSVVSSNKERKQMSDVLYEISIQSHKMTMDCLRLNERIIKSIGKRTKGTIVCDLSIIECESDETGPINHFGTDRFYGRQLEDMPDWILHVNRALFALTSLSHFEMPIGRDCEWIYEANRTPEDVYKQLYSLGFSDPDIARIKQLRMSVSYKTEEDYIINPMQ